MYLHDQGFRWHEHLLHTYTKNKHYFAAENRKLLAALNAYRESKKD